MDWLRLLCFVKFYWGRENYDMAFIADSQKFAF